MRLMYVVTCGLPTAHESYSLKWSFGLALLAASSVLSRYKLAEATLVLRAGAILGLSTPLFATYCADIFFTGRNHPIIDPVLAAADHALGFDWLTYARFLDRHEVLWTITAWAYSSIFLQFGWVIAALAFSRDASRLYIYLLAQTLTLSSVALIAMFLPALGAYEQYDVAHAGLQHIFGISEQVKSSIMWLRSGAHGSYGVKDIPLITFPSFHASCAVLFAWATWHVPVYRWAGIALNIVMMTAIPIHGCHYFVDLIFGTVIASLFLVFSRAIVKHLKARKKATSFCI